MVKITVIMPSLNVAKYISKCMESVLGQSLKEIEILAIDAGSTDGTREILQSYAVKDARVKMIHSDKKSYGYQVNLGLSMAVGEYVGIVETDDWIETDIYEILYRYACQYRPDYIRGIAENSINFTEDLAYSVPMSIFPKKEYERCNGIIQINPERMKTLFLIDCYLWNGIYDRGFLQGIRLNESYGAAYQDMGFLSQVYCKAKKAVYVNHLMYHYRKDNENSSFYSHNAFRYLINEYRFVWQHLPDDNDRRRLVDIRYFRQLCGHFRQMAEGGVYWEEEQPYILQIRDYFRGRYDLRELLSEKRKEEFDWFMESPRNLYCNLREEVVQWEKSWQQTLGLFANREIVIYGSGVRGHYLHCLLASRQIGKVIGFCDKDVNKQGGRLNGLTIEGLEYWKQYSKDICYAITVHGHYNEVEEYLLENKVPQDCIVIFERRRFLPVLLRKRVNLEEDKVADDSRRTDT